MQHQTSESKEFYADNVHCIWNLCSMFINDLTLPDEIEKDLCQLFFRCNDYLVSIGKWVVDDFAKVDE